MEAVKKKGNGFTVWKLISVLKKCNGKAEIGSGKALISPKAAKMLAYVGLGLLAAAVFCVCFFLEPVAASFAPVDGIARLVMLAMFIMSFMMAIKNIVTVLYTADDLPVLLPLPLSAGQIVAAKLVVASDFSVKVSVFVINTICLGFGIRAGMGASYIIGTVLSGVLIPVTAIALAAFLVVIVFRVFGFIRNRDITVLIGGIFSVLLIVAYMFVSNRLQAGETDKTAAVIFSSVSVVMTGFPNIRFMCDFMFDGSIPGLLFSVAITAAVIALALLMVKLFYLSTALSMQNTGVSKKAVTKDALNSRKTSVLKALTRYDVRCTRRNPSYLIYGFVMSMIWPLLLILPIAFGQNSFFSHTTFPLDSGTTLLGGMFLGILASCFSCGFNVLPVCAFSREGGTFSALCALPIDFRDLFKSKRNFSLFVCSIGSILYIMIAGILSLAFGFIRFADSWIVLYAAAISFLLNVTFIDFMLLRDSKKPNLTWDTETEIARKLCWINIVILIVGFAAYLGFILSFVLVPVLIGTGDAVMSGNPTIIPAIVCAVTAAAVLLLAFAVNRHAVRKGAENLKNLG